MSRRMVGSMPAAVCVSVVLLQAGCSRTDQAGHRTGMAGAGRSVTPAPPAATGPITWEQFADMQSSDELTRLRAVKAVGALGKDAVTPLVRRLEGPGDANLRRSCVEALEWIGPEARTAVPALVRLLGDNTLREPAVCALRKIGPGAREAVPALSTLLAGAPEPLKRQIELTLAEVSAEPSGPDISPREIRRLIDAVCEEVEAEDPLIGHSFMEADRLVIRQLDALEAHDTKGRDALRRLKAMGRRAAPELANSLAETYTGYDSNRRLSALVVVYALGPEAREAIPMVVRFVTLGAPRYYSESEQAIKVLERLARQPRLADLVIPVMIELKDPKPIRAAGPLAVPHLIKALRVKPLPAAKKPSQGFDARSYWRDDWPFSMPPWNYSLFSIPLLLGEIGPPAKEAVPALLEALVDLATFDEAAWALSRIVPEDAPRLVEPRLIQALRADPASQRAALRALYRMRTMTPAVEKALVELALRKPESGPPASVEAAVCIVALLSRISPGSLTSPLFDRMLDELRAETGPATDRRQVAVRIGDFGERAAPAVPLLLAMLKPKPPAPAPPAKEVAPNRGLGPRPKTPMVPEERRREFLEKTITPVTADYSSGVRRLVAESIGRIGRPAVPILIGESKKGGDRSYRELIVHALGTTGRLEGAAVSSLLPLIRDPEIGMPVANIVEPHVEGEARETVRQELVNALSDPERVIGASLILSRMDPELADKKAVPALRSFAKQLAPAGAYVSRDSRQSMALELASRLERGGKGGPENDLPSLLGNLEKARPEDWASKAIDLTQALQPWTLSSGDVKAGAPASVAMSRIVDLLPRGTIGQRGPLLSLLAWFPLSEADWARLAPFVLDAFANGTPDQRQDAARVVQKCGPNARRSKKEFARYLNRADTRIEAARCLLAIDPSDPVVAAPLVESLPNKFYSSKRDPHWPLSELRGRADDEAVRLLAGIVEDKAAPLERRRVAAHELTARDPARGVRTVVPVLKDLGGRPHAYFGLDSYDTAEVLVGNFPSQGHSDTGAAWSGVVPHLVRLIEDKNPEGQLFACEVLAGLGHVPEAGAAEPALAGFAESSRKAGKAVPRAAAIALVRISQDPVRWIPDLAGWISPYKDAVWKALLELGEPVVPVMAAGLLDRKRAPRWRYAVMIFLGKLGGRARAAVPSLIETARREDDPLRVSAAHALGQIGPDARAAVPALGELLLDTKGKLMPGTAAESLGYIGAAAAPAVPALLRRLETGDRSLKWRVVVCLGRIGKAAEPAVARLKSLLSDDSLRFWALDALGRISPESEAVREAAKSLRHDGDPWVRSLACKLSELVG